MKERINVLGVLTLFRNLKTGKHFISNLYGRGVYYEVGDLIEVRKEDFEKYGLDIILTHLQKDQQPSPPDDRISHKDIRYKTRGMKEVTISLKENGELGIYPVRGNDHPREGGADIPSDCDIKMFLNTLDKVFEYSRRSR